MDTDFLFGSLHFGTELHVKMVSLDIVYGGWNSKHVDSRGNTSLCQTQFLLVFKIWKHREPHTCFGSFSQYALTFCFDLGDAFRFRESGRL